MNKIIKQLAISFLFLLSVLMFSPLTVFANAPASNEDKTVVLNKDKIINHDYFAGGSRVIIDGRVNGDAYIAGGMVDVNGTINGDLLVLGGQVVIRGTVTQNIRAVGGTISVEGTVGKNVSMAGGNLTIDSGAKISGNAVIAGGNFDLRAPVKNLTLAGGNARIENDVVENVRAAIGTLDVEQGVNVKGNLDYWSSDKANFGQGATISGITTFHKTETPESFRKSSENAASGSFGLNLFFTLVSFITSLILGIILIKLLPIFTEKTAESAANKFWLNLFVGFIVLVVTPVLAIILMITLIGFPIALILLFSYGVVIYLAKLFVVMAFGKYISKLLNWKLTLSWAFVVGLLLYYILGFVPVLGWMIKTVITLVGMGAIVISEKNYFETLRNKKLI